MPKEKEKTTTEEGGKETGKEQPVKASEVIEIRHTFETPKGTASEKVVEPPATGTGEKPEKTGKEGGEKPATGTGEKAGKEEKVETPVPSVKDLQAQLVDEKKRREAAELIVEAQATKAFETEKTEFLALIPDEAKRTELEEKIGDDPIVLNEYKRMSSFFTTMLEKAGVKVIGKPEKTGKEGEGATEGGGEAGTGEGAGAGAEGGTEGEEEGEEEGGTPAGKVTLPPPPKAGAESYKAYIDNLYEILQDPEKTAKERKFADQKINELFSAMGRGMKESGSFAYLPKTSACPNCNYTLSNPETETCPSCGWKHDVKRRDLPRVRR